MLGGWSPKHLSKRGHPRVHWENLTACHKTRRLTSSSPYERPWAPRDWRSQKIIFSDLLFWGIQREQPTESQEPQPRGKFEVPGSAIAFWATALCHCTWRPGPDSTNRWEAGFTYCILTSRVEGQPDDSCLESTFPPIIVPSKFVSACKGWTNLLFWLWYSAFRFQNVRLGLQEAQIQPAWKYN